MIEAGKSFCPYCVRTHEEAFYSDSGIGWGVVLGRNRFSGKYEVNKKNFPGKQSPNGKIILGELNGEEIGLPSAIDIQWTEGEKGQETSRERKLFRSCPVCAEKYNIFRPVNSVLGRYPTFVVALVGDTAAGKSVFVDAIATIANTNAVNCAKYVHELRYTIPAPNGSNPESTPEESRGRSKVLLICDRQDNNRVVAAVYLVDVAGELYKSKKEDEKTGAIPKGLLWNLLNSNRDYPGADAYIFVEPAVKKDKKMDGENKGDAGYTADQIYIDLKKAGLLKDRPIAYVMTHADELIDSQKFNEVYSSGDGKAYKVMTEDTFNLKQPTSYAREQMLARVALEHAIVRSYEPTVLHNPITKCFLVRSCALVTEEHMVNGVKNTKLREDLSASRNVMDPLIWILNKLKLFPLRKVVK